MNQRLALDGTWDLLPVASFHHGRYPSENAVWVQQELPAHWQQHPLFQYYAGRMVYRKRFSQGSGVGGQGSEDPEPRSPTPDHRFWLRFNGIFYRSRAYFNGSELGQHEGYFAPHEYEISQLMRAENELLVEVECPDEHDRTGKQLITGVFSHWDSIDPETNPGGIWQTVEILATGSTRIKHLLLDSERIEPAQAQVRFRLVLDAAKARDLTLRWTITPKNFVGQVQTVTQERRIEAGEHELLGGFPIRDPQLWWTHDLGHPNCYSIGLEITHNGVVSDTYQTTFGLRMFELRNWIAYLNGVRLFVKGCNYAPGDVRMATMTRKRCEQDVRLARDCHMNLLRIHAHVDVQELYEVADEAGVLLWQDMPLQWLYRREVLPEAERQARAMVRLLYNHPSVVIWCMHNEPVYVADTKDERMLPKLRTYSTALGYSWNRDVMDSQLKRAAEAEDSSRPVIRSSGEYAVPGIRGGTDTHFYYGWYTVYGTLRQWESLVKRLPANIRFVTEFGAQSFPNLESCLRFMDGDIAKIDWNTLVARHQFQPDILAHWVEWRRARTLAELIEMTQRYQIEVNRFYVDRLRFHKYKPTGGVVPYTFHDPNPSVQWSIVDYWRVPKASYHALRMALSPQYAFSLLELDEYPANKPIELPVYLVNDAQQVAIVVLLVRLQDETDHELARIERSATLPADCLPIEIERLRLTPPRAGTYRLELTWDCAGEQLTNTYTLRVA